MEEYKERICMFLIFDDHSPLPRSMVQIKYYMNIYSLYTFLSSDNLDFESLEDRDANTEDNIKLMLQNEREAAF